MKIIEYKAHAGFGIIFPAKTFLAETESQIYIISPGPLNEDVMSKLSKTSKKINFIAPNNVHNMYLKQAKENFPKANFYGPKRSQKQSGVELLPTKSLPQDDIETIFIGGNKAISETCFFLKTTKELILTDLIFNMHHKMNFPTKMAMKMAGTYQRLGTSRLFLSAINDKEAFKRSLKKLLSLDPEKVYVNHGEALTKEQFENHVKKLL